MLKRYDAATLDALNKALGIDRVEEMKKSALTTNDFSATGLLKREQADMFIDLTVDESTLLSAVTVHKTDAAAGEIANLDITGPITEKATENNDSGNTSKPTPDPISFTVVKSRSAIDITGEVSTDTIEGTGVTSKIMQATLKAVRNDREQLAMHGDASISSSSTATDRLLKTNNGWLLQLVSSGTTADAGGKRVSRAFLSKMFRSLPTRYRRNRSALRWIISSNAYLDMLAELQAINTPVADDVRRTGVLPAYLGVPFLEVPLLLEDMTIDGTSGDLGTQIVLGDPKNLIWVVQREMSIEWLRVPRSDRTEGTMYMRDDFVIADMDAMVIGTSVNTDENVALYGATA